MKLLSIYSESFQIEEENIIEEKLFQASYPYLLLSGTVFNHRNLKSRLLECVDSIATNEDICIAVTIYGKVYGWGEDTQGLLGVYSNITEAIQIKGLSDISQVSLSYDHAAAITGSGKLFTWGSLKSAKLGDVEFEKNYPKIVPSSSEYEAIKVITGQDYTGILTSGGYLMIYGVISSNHSPLQHSPRKGPSKSFLPYSNSNLDRSPVVQVYGTSHFILAILENYDLVAFDGCLNLSYFKVPEIGFEYAIANDEKVVGVSTDGILCWTKSTFGKFECPVKSWTAKRFMAVDDFKVWSWGKGYLLNSNSSGALILDSESECYNSIDTGKKQAGSSLLKSNIISPSSRMESLKRLFPGDEEGKIISKIMKCQEEFSNRTIIQDAFKGLVRPIVKQVFFLIKEYVKKKKTLILAKSAARVFCVFEKIFCNKFLNKFYSWKRKNAVFGARLSLRDVKKKRDLRRKNLGKIQVCLKRIIIFIEAFQQNKKRDVFDLLSEIYNKTKATLYILKGLEKKSLIERFEKWRKEYMKKLVFIKSLEEKKFFCVQDWIRKILWMIINEGRNKEIYLTRSGKGSEKIEKFLHKIWLKNAISRYKEILISKKADKLKSSIFSKRLCVILNLIFLTRFKSDCRSAFVFIRSLKPKQMKKTFIFPKTRQKKSPIFFLFQVLHSKTSSYFRSIISSNKPKFHSSFYLLIFSLNKFTFQKQLGFKVFSLNSIKYSAGFLSSFDYHSDMNLLEIPSCKTNFGSMQFSTTSSPKYNKSMERIDIPKNTPTSFNRGQLIAYQKYLIKKKNLEMIEENSFYENGKIFKFKNTKIKQKKTEKIRPPWKPSSISANFVFVPKTVSSTKKAIEYYENSVQKSERYLLSPDKSEEPHLFKFLKGKQNSKYFEFFEKTHSSSPYNNLIESEHENFSPDTLIDIGIAVMICSKIDRKFSKNSVFKKFEILKSLKSKNQNKSKMATWKVRSISIGLSNLKRVLVSNLKGSFFRLK